jgi:hypothetical protein
MALHRRGMGWVFDFAKRRIAGYIIFWSLVIFLLVFVFQGDTPAQAGWLVVFGLAFVGSLVYTRRMKRGQRARRAAAEQAERMQQWQAQWAQWQQMQRIQQMRQSQQAQQTPPTPPTQPPGSR